MLRALAAIAALAVVLAGTGDPARGLTPTAFERFEPADAKTGSLPGERLPDFVYWSAGSSERAKPSDLRGRVVFLHFWGAWCPPCRREMPLLADLYARYRDNPEIVFVFVTIGEPLATTQDFVAKGGRALPLFETGSAKGDRKVTLPTGARERAIDHLGVRVYPATIVLDRNGIVTWRHSNERNDWADIAPALDRLIARPR